MKVVRGSRRVCRAWRIARYLTVTEEATSEDEVLERCNY
jgi:hypothetical protein